MIPRIPQADATHGRYLAFLDAVRRAGFRGELESCRAQRVAAATDNSIYQIVPQAVAFPCDTDDVVRLTMLANEPRFHEIVLSPRGGGTGTNGQSLTDGIVVDLSRHMTSILEIDAKRCVARVQAGVVKDQLEAALEPHGMFFAPELSTSNRATIGGMVATDACGQGSVLYGKTRDHVLALRSVLLDGTVWMSAPLDDKALAETCERRDRVGALCRTAAEEVSKHAELIRDRFPPLTRCLTGYDLAHVRDGDGRFDPNALLCGAEGTLAIVVEATIRLTPKPRCKALVNVGYANFDTALRHARTLMAAKPASIETIDSLVLSLARGDIVWQGVSDCFPDQEDVLGVNLVEFVADDDATIAESVSRLIARLDGEVTFGAKPLGYRVVLDEKAISRVWAMRKRAVGLLGNVASERRPVPFVEDTAVPPECLADYIRDFRAVLDAEGLTYGMFGHVDAGVLHVRPALDMKDPGDERRVRRITDQVVALTRRYGGLLWGEHGKGVRSEFVPGVFGPLYPSLQRIKAAADPRNQLNPGKICAPEGNVEALPGIDTVPTRGQADRTVPAVVREAFPHAMHCNGNGACFNYDPNDAMCPTWKATRDRVHSPKGRASLMREWLRLVAKQGTGGSLVALKRGNLLARTLNTMRRAAGEYDFSHEVRLAMTGCVSCKSCATQCPVRVDVAELRSQFLDAYYTRYLRGLRAHAVCGMEAVLPVASRFQKLYNLGASSALGRAALKQFVGLVDGPRLSVCNLRREMHARGLQWADAAAFTSLAPEDRARAVIVAQDAFTTFFDTPTLLATLELLRALDFIPLLAPFVPNGKAMHVHGFREAFRQVATRNATALLSLEASGLPIVGVEPAVVLTYRQEYASMLGAENVPQVSLLQEFLVQREAQLIAHVRPVRSPYVLLTHCTERTNAPGSIAYWQKVFAALGQTLEAPALGCCGMAGTYGHEREHAATSRQIYEQSWAPVVRDVSRRGRLVATGYSCRAQAKRFDKVHLPHPAEALLRLVQSPAGSADHEAGVPRYPAAAEPEGA